MHLGFFYQAQKRYKHAREHFFKILEIDPDFLPAHYQIGRTAVFTGVNLEEGLAHLQTYLEHEPGQGQPSWADAHYRMAMIYELIENPEQARIEYEKALEINPEHGPAKEGLAKLK